MTRRGLFSAQLRRLIHAQHVVSGSDTPVGHRGHAQSAFSSTPSSLSHCFSRSVCAPGDAPCAVRRWQARSRCAKCAGDGHSSVTSELASSERRLGLPGHAHARHEAGAHPRDAVRVALTPRRACAGGYCWCPGWSVRPRRTRPIRAVGTFFPSCRKGYNRGVRSRGSKTVACPRKSSLQARWLLSGAMGRSRLQCVAFWSRLWSCTSLYSF